METSVLWQNMVKLFTNHDNFWNEKDCVSLIIKTVLKGYGLFMARNKTFRNIDLLKPVVKHPINIYQTDVYL